MTTKPVVLQSTVGSHTTVLGPSGTQNSVLAELTPDENSALLEWCDQQPRSPGGSVDAMGWPGWEAVADRRFKARLEAGPSLSHA